MSQLDGVLIQSLPLQSKFVLEYYRRRISMRRKRKICAYNHSHSDYQLARRAIVNGAPSRLPQNDGMEAYDERD